MTATKILIIGGGLAGLSLGQGLKQAGIAFKIFERDQAASFRAQGYRIRIDQNGGDALRRLLPSTVFNTFEATSAEVLHGGKRLDAVTGEPITAGMSRMPPSKPGATWNADRTVLRNVLLTGLDSYTEFGKKLDRYELFQDGVVAHFADGSSEAGSMIVGADGASSRVRKQMLPDHLLHDSEGRAVYGKTLIEEDTFQNIPAEIGTGICLLGTDAEPRIKLFCDVMRFKRGTKVDLPQDYVYWVLLFNKACVGKSDTELSSLTDVQSAAFAEELSLGWHQKVRAVITRQLKEAASTLHFLMMKPPIKSWNTDTRLALLGDSAHAMLPIGGVGANTAFQDAADLLDVLKEGADLGSLSGYEELLRERSSKSLAMSAGGGVHFFGMKPIEELKPAANW